MRCLVARCDTQVLRFPIPESAVRLGASLECDLVLPFRGVSGVHAKVAAFDGGVMFSDAGSKNGIVVAGRRLRQFLLREGKTVSLGRAHLTIEDTPSDDLRVAIELPRAAPLDAREETESFQNLLSSDPASAALHLIREIEGGARSPSMDQRVLEQARALLGCTGLVEFEAAGDAGAIIHALSGSITEGIDLAALAAVANGRREQELAKANEEGTALVARRRQSYLAAIFVSPHSIADWERDFLEYLAARVLRHGESRNSSARKALDTRQRAGALVIPPEMILGESPAMRAVLTQLEATVHSGADVLLLGETGTGKELFARIVHDSGPTSTGPFVPVNCAAIPRDLLEAELFGVRGRVATGVDPHPGILSLAEGGTVFFDEIGELHESLQAKILRFLQEREVQPVGASSPRKVTIRVISASNRDLRDLVREGRFRADLYYRLRGLQFHLPPLRDRVEEIPLLVTELVHRLATEEHRHVRGVSQGALTILLAHFWPGNVRELIHELRRAVLVCPDGGTIQSEHLGTVRWEVQSPRVALRSEVSGEGLTAPAPELGHDLAEGKHSVSLIHPLQQQIEALERTAISGALRQCNGNRTEAARLLGLSRYGLTLKIRRMGIQ